MTKGRGLTFMLCAGLVIIHQSAAWAFYDDVHYSLNYYIARVIGFAPEQAHRLAKACMSIDYAKETELTQ